jgi:hypothetical protein
MKKLTFFPISIPKVHNLTLLTPLKIYKEKQGYPSLTDFAGN